MKTLSFKVVVENIPDTVTKDYRIAGGICSGATDYLRRHFGVGINVAVFEPEQPNAKVSPRFKVFYLWFDQQDGRYTRDGYGLHCGDCVEALIDGSWIQTRVEHTSSSKHSHGFYLVGRPDQPLENLPVRKEAA